MQDNQENKNKDDSEKFNQKNGIRNEENITNKNCILSNCSSKITTKVSKLIYDPPKQATRAIIKTTHTYGHKISSQPSSSLILETESPAQLDNDKNVKTSTFKTRDINKFPEKKSNESPDITTNPINKNHEFIKKKLEREKDIEDIQKMLNQINTSCHENDNQYRNSPSTVDNIQINKTETNPKLHNMEIQTINIPSYTQTKLNLDLNNTISDNNCNANQNNMSIPEVPQKNSKNLEENNKKTYLHPSESDLNLRRSQTDTNLKTQFLLSPQKPISSSRTPTTIRTKSSINLFSRDSSKMTLETEAATKKKSYDPNEARRFMKEQRIKRHQQKIVQKGQTQNQTNNVSGVDKEAIKKRLEDLRKSTLKILEKNVKIKEKQQKLKKIDNKDDKTSNLNTRRSNKTILKISNSKGILVLEKQPQENKFETNDKEYVNKKIGLLRKPETEDHSFSVLKDFNINKENFNINMKTPTLIEETSQIDDGFRKITDTVMFKKAPEKSIFENGNNKNLHNNNENSSGIINLNEKQINNQENDFELIIPDKKLERKVSLREKSIQVDPLQQPIYKSTVENVTKQNGLPYWLKPTPVQYYPYNFIMAVRKKLEAITNPVITNNDNKKHKKNAKKSHKEVIKTQETPLTYPKERKEAVRRRIVDEKNFNINVNDYTEQNIQLNLEKSNKNINLPIEKIEKIKSNANNNHGTAHSSKSVSEEITSNFSSISIHVPESHTISDFSSLLSLPSNKHKNSQKSAVNNSTKISDQQQRNIKMLHTKLNFIHEDDTTISSSVFSSPEKKILKKPSNSFADELNKNLNIELGNTAAPLSPLSVDNINKLKIQSKSNLDTVNLQRGNNTGGNNDFDIPEQLQLTSNLPSNLVLNKQKKHISSTSKTNSSSRSIQKSENLDFSQLLEDFNKSLSQVIEVNQQLKETLKKSNQMLSPNKKKIVNGTSTSSHGEVAEYTSDFDKEISQNDQNRYMDNKHLKRTGSIQSKTDEYTSDFEEEEPTSVEQKIKENITSNTNTSVKSEIILNIPQTKTSLVTIPVEKLQSISSSNTKITEKLLNKNDYNNVQEEISTNQSPNATEEFIDSIEESSNRKATANSSISEQITESIDKNKEIFENVIIEEVENEENSIHKNYYQNSKDHSAGNSVSQSKNDFIKNHINNSRGDFNIEQENDDGLTNNTITTTQQIENYIGSGPPPAYGMVPQENMPMKDSINSTICSEFIAVFNRSDVELSIYSQNESSEATLNYSSIGMYEQLLQSETSKSDQLAALLKMREKALMDRTRGQIAWLEVQKEKYKSKGLSAQISHIKKKQRAILMKMEKEREEIKWLIQNQQTQASTTRCIVSDRQQQQKIHSYRPKLAENISDISIRKNFTKNSNITTTTATTKINSSNKIVRGFEIQSNQNLENILLKREEELRKRRAHVECLMEWHQRLDKEEQEVFQLERMLFEHNVVASSSEHQKQSKYQSELQANSTTNTSKQSDKLKNEKKLFEINKSLRELQNISSRSTDNTTSNQNPDYERITGKKLNKLWRRLTGQKHIEKFENTRKYKIYKNDVEQLYEEAKIEVLREFGNQQHEMMELFEQSKCIETTTATTSSLEDCSADNQFIVPSLNLNFSSEQSYIDEQQTNCSSVFYKSSIQKQFQASDNDLLKNIQEHSISKSNNLTDDGILSAPQVNQQQLEQITKLHSEKLENHVEQLNFEKSTNEKPLNINNDLSSNQMFGENIENTKIETKIISELPIGFDSLVEPNTTEKFISTDENNSASSSKIQITKVTDILSDITENKTSDDITSLSLEEQNKSIENNSKSIIIDANSTLEDTKLNYSTETFSTSNTKIQSNIENSTIVDQRLVENIELLNQNIERVSVIVMPSKENNSENIFENIIKSPDSHIITSITDTEPVIIESVITSPIEEITKLSEEEINSDISKITEKESQISSELIIETTNLENIDSASNLENIDSKINNSSILENYSKSDSIKSAELEYVKDQLFSEKDNISPEKSINSDVFESPTQLDNSKQLSESPHQSYLILSDQNFSSSPISINSPISITSHILTATELEQQKSNIIEGTEEEYDNDFSGSSSDMTYLEDVTAPKFELTMEDTKQNLDDESNLLDENDQSNDEKSNSTTELEKRLIDLDVSLKDLHNTFDRALSPDKNSITPPPASLLSPPLTINLNKSTDDTTNIKFDLEKTKFSLSPRNYNITSNNDNATLMPDIINEVEIRRRQQILIESEIKQLEQTVPPYVFLREIPNKPPPPYVPPAHGSPMTIIFPSEDRIKEITFRRTKELYDEILKTDKNTDKNDVINSTTPPTLIISQSKSILDENITNIYERIILDICKECMQDYKDILTNFNPETYKSSLALFNPPDRLKCMQEFVYRHVRKLLSMEKKSNALQKNSVISIGRKKRDHVDEILIQELYEEENKWTNFDQEEEEVKLAIVDEILNNIVKDVIGEVTDINIKKLEFLTNYSSVNLNNDEEET